jgi:hypothetical protein
VARKRVTEHVPANATEARPLAGSPERVLALALRQKPATAVGEDEVAAQMAMALQGREDLVAERDLSRLARLRRAHSPRTTF